MSVISFKYFKYLHDAVAIFSIQGYLVHIDIIVNVGSQYGSMVPEPMNWVSVFLIVSLGGLIWLKYCIEVLHTRRIFKLNT